MVRGAICLAHVSGRHSPTATAAAAAADIRWIQQCTRQCPGRRPRPLRELLLPVSAAHAPPPGISCGWRTSRPQCFATAAVHAGCDAPLPGVSPPRSASAGHSSSSEGPRLLFSVCHARLVQANSSRLPLSAPGEGYRALCPLSPCAVGNHVSRAVRILRIGRASDILIFSTISY